MKKVDYEENWLASWKYSYPYDLLEIYGEEYRNFGYAYAYSNRKDHTLNYVKSVLPTGGKILDVAAAQGNFSILLAELGYKVTWNDIREDLIGYVKLKSDSENLSFQGGNVFDIKFPHLFDIILATEILEHVAHPDQFLTNLSELLEKDGYIIITTPLGSYFKNKLPKFTEFSDPSLFEFRQFGPNSSDHIFLFHLDEMYKVAEMSGLEVVSMKCYTNPLTNGHIKLNILLKYIPKKIIFALDRFTQSLPHFIAERIHTSFVCLLRKKVIR